MLVVAGHGEPVHRLDAAAGAGRNASRVSVEASYVANHVRAGTHPSPSGGVGSAVLAISTQNTCRRPSTVSPPSGQNHRLSGCSPVPVSNDCGAAAVPRWSSVKHVPCWTIAVLWANADWSRRGRWRCGR